MFPQVAHFVAELGELKSVCLVHTGFMRDDLRFTLRLGKNEDGSRYFLLRGAEFKAEDWKAIERRAGLLKPGMRAIVWVCDDGSTPVIDWRPAEE